MAEIRNHPIYDALMATLVILTDERGNSIGTEETSSVHLQGGKLHRAFSVFIFNIQDEVLLQRRSHLKLHFRGLWSNTCCGHPPPGEHLTAAAERRLFEEMGFTTPLREATTLLYKAADPLSGLTEYEYDHILVRIFDGRPTPDPREADGWRWVKLEFLLADLSRNPAGYTPWLPQALRKLAQQFDSKF